MRLRDRAAMLAVTALLFACGVGIKLFPSSNRIGFGSVCRNGFRFSGVVSNPRVVNSSHLTHIGNATDDKKLARIVTFLQGSRNELLEGYDLVNQAIFPRKYRIDCPSIIQFMQSLFRFFADLVLVEPSSISTSICISEYGSLRYQPCRLPVIHEFYSQAIIYKFNRASYPDPWASLGFHDPFLLGVDYGLHCADSRCDHNQKNRDFLRYVGRGDSLLALAVNVPNTNKKTWLFTITGFSLWIGGWYGFWRGLRRWSLVEVLFFILCAAIGIEIIIRHC